MYSLRLEDTSVREPHWHPITAELGSVHRGQARMTIQDPDTSTDTYTLNPGDMYYIPAAYPHQIEVLPEGGKDVHFCIFFDQPMPQDIGYKATAEGIPHEAMAATLGIKRAGLPKLEGTTGNPLIVRRINDVDMVKEWILYAYRVVTVPTVQRVPCNMVNYTRFIRAPRKLHPITYFSSVHA
jgi:oxalate decarboxylase